MDSFFYSYNYNICIILCMSLHDGELSINNFKCLQAIVALLRQTQAVTEKDRHHVSMWCLLHLVKYQVW